MSQPVLVMRSLVFAGLFPNAALGTVDLARAAALVSQLQDDSDPVATGTAFMELRLALSSAPVGERNTLQAQLCAVLRGSTDPRIIRRVALVLSAAPCEEAVSILALRLDRNPPRALGLALCEAIHAFADRRPNLAPATAELALERLGTVARNPHVPGPVVEAAILAHATFGASGFDRLISLESNLEAPDQAHVILIVALAETDDLRALATLRAIAANPSSTEGQRLQALYGLGRMCLRARVASRAVDGAEETLCASAVRSCLHETTSDQVFAAALKALAQIVPMDQDLWQLTAAALTAGTEVRREAATDVLFEQDGPLTAFMIEQVRQIAASDIDATVRAAAAAVLEKQEALLDGQVLGGAE